MRAADIGVRAFGRRSKQPSPAACLRRESQKLGSGSGRGGRAPRLERFASEEAERSARCKIALGVEIVVDGGVNGQEVLRRSRRFEALHLVLAPSRIQCKASILQ